MERTQMDEVHKVNIGRHRSQCTICAHPHRAGIEEEWINWASATQLAAYWGFSRFSLYRHAHALGLFRQRRQNIRMIYERILERVDSVAIGGAVILSTADAYRKILAEEERSEQTQAPGPREWLGRMSAAEREAFVRDGTLPDWMSGDGTATPGDEQKDETENQSTDDTKVQ